jgi:pimeloyl-ACP methyl ester carboxylesterase
MKFAPYKHAGLTFSVAESGDGPTMIFQHGLCGDAAQPFDFFPPGAGWRCVTLECRGHGSSDAGATENFSIANFAEDVISLIEARKLAPVVIGGISMGAAISLRIAVRRPDLVRALALVRPAWLTAAAPENMRPIAEVGELLRRFTPEQASEVFEGSEIARRLQCEAPDNLASLRGFFRRLPIATTRELLCRIAAGTPDITSDDVAAIAIPTLVIGCARDFIHPLEFARTLASRIAGARFVEVAAKAGYPELYRDQVRSTIADFLTEITG